MRYFTIRNLFASSVFFTALVTHSCKNTTSNSNESWLASEISIVEDSTLLKNYYFKVDMHLKVSLDDNFQLFYLSSEDLGFSEANSIRVNVTGKDSIQKIEFILPDEVIPSRLRLDLGDNPDQPLILFDKGEITYQNKVYTLDYKMMENLFKPNGFVKFNYSDGGFETLTIDGSYDPYLVSVSLEDILIELMDY